MSGLPFILTPTVRATTLLWSPTPLIYGTAGVYLNDKGAAIGGAVHRRSTQPIMSIISPGRSDGFGVDPHRTFAIIQRPKFFPARPRKHQGVKRRRGLSSSRMNTVRMCINLTASRAAGSVHSNFPTVSPVTNLGTRPPMPKPAPTETAPAAVAARSRFKHTQGRGREQEERKGLRSPADGENAGSGLAKFIDPKTAGTGSLGHFTRIVTINIDSGRVTGQYAYPLCDTTKVYTPGQPCGTTVSSKPKFTSISELLAVNNHQFLVDERDGKGFEGGGSAVYKVLNLIDITAPGVKDVSNNPSFLKQDPTSVALHKTPFLDVVQVTKGLLDPSIDLPRQARRHHVWSGRQNRRTQLKHTLYLSSDNDFLASFETDSDNATKPSTVLDNPEQNIRVRI